MPCNCAHLQTFVFHFEHNRLQSTQTPALINWAPKIGFFELFGMIYGLMVQVAGRVEGADETGTKKGLRGFGLGGLET